MLLFVISLLPCTAGLLRLYYMEAFYNNVDELCMHVPDRPASRLTS